MLRIKPVSNERSRIRYGWIERIAADDSAIPDSPTRLRTRHCDGGFRSAPHNPKVARAFAVGPPSGVFMSVECCSALTSCLP